jgi:hypothetical protein
LQREQRPLGPAEGTERARQGIAGPAADSFRRITDGMVVPASIDRFRRVSSGHCATMAATSTASPISGANRGCQRPLNFGRMWALKIPHFISI